MVLVACGEPHDRRNVQQPGEGASTMLGPPFTVTIACVPPGGMPATTKLGAIPLATQSTLLLVPSTRGLAPPTSSPPQTKPTAWPPDPAPHAPPQTPPSTPSHPPR